MVPPKVPVQEEQPLLGLLKDVDKLVVCLMICGHTCLTEAQMLSALYEEEVTWLDELSTLNRQDQDNG